MQLRQDRGDIPGQVRVRPGAEGIVQVPADFAVHFAVGIVVGFPGQRIRIHPAADVDIVSFVRGQGAGQGQLRGAERVIPDRRVRILRQGSADERLDLAFISFGAVLPVLQIPGGRLRIEGAAGVPLPLRGGDRALPAAVVPVAFPGRIVPAQGRLLVFPDGRRGRLKGGGDILHQVPVLLQDLLQAGDAALVNLHREGREEFLFGHEDSPSFLCWTYGNKGWYDTHRRIGA